MASKKLQIVIDAQNNASRQFKKLEMQIKGFSKSFGFEMGAIKKMSKYAMAGIAGAGAAMTGVGVMAIKTAAKLEQERMAFKTLLGSTQKADEALKMIKKDAAKTPFELPGLIQANKLLTAVTHDAKKSEGILLNVGKALSAMGKGQPELDRIIVNLQQIGAVGHASMLDIKQFAFAGIPIFEMLQKTTGKTGEELSDMISQGGVTFDMLTKMFEKAGGAGGRFENAFKDQAGTFNQLVSNMKDNFTVLSAEIAEKSGVFDIVKNALKQVQNWVEKNQDAIIKIVGGALRSFVDKIKEAVKWLIQNKETLKSLWTGIKAFGTIVWWVVKFITKALSILQKTLETVFYAVFRAIDIFQEKWEKLKEAVKHPIKAVVSLFKSDKGNSKRATGGSVMSGRPYLVGERGAELFVPSVSGKIINNPQLATASATNSISVNINGGMYLDRNAGRKLAEVLSEELRTRLRL